MKSVQARQRGKLVAGRVVDEAHGTGKLLGALLDRIALARSALSAGGQGRGLPRSNGKGSNGSSGSGRIDNVECGGRVDRANGRFLGDRGVVCHGSSGNSLRDARRWAYAMSLRVEVHELL
jgi:hypothetical protein